MTQTGNAIELYLCAATDFCTWCRKLWVCISNYFTGPRYEEVRDIGNLNFGFFLDSINYRCEINVIYNSAHLNWKIPCLLSDYLCALIYSLWSIATSTEKCDFYLFSSSCSSVLTVSEPETRLEEARLTGKSLITVCCKPTIVL